ncbi:sortase [Candidatus Parcubacteria bacterium]|nr:sortase [Candidatus Parcubacteria bacterium]
MPEQTIFEKVYARKWLFAGLFTLAYFISLSALSALGFTPWGTGSSFGDFTPQGGSQVAVEEGELPVRIEIPKVGIRANVNNPNQTSVAALDQSLLSGAVRYPSSGVPGEEGNVLIFGHSSHLPVVHNQAFRAFNDIQNLEEGDPVFIVGKEKVYVYSVDRVQEANTATDAIPLAVSGAKLTLATCNNFGTKEDRFIVTATLVAVEPLPGV